MQKICLVKTSVGSMADAKELAAGLMESQLAACVQISAEGVSMYVWEGRVETSCEHYLSIKTSAANKDLLIDWLKDHHPYSLPEIIWHACEASDEYAAWVNESGR